MIYFKYLKSLLLHKWWVFLAGRKLKLPLWTLIIHDWQKFTPSEFSVYARYFFDNKKNKKEFMFTWLHHVHRGPHHWEYWLLNPKYNFSDAVKGKIPMPEKYIKEMVADWMGASKTYTGSWNMCTWLNDNYENIVDNLNPLSEITLDYSLFDLGYDFDFEFGWHLYKEN